MHLCVYFGFALSVSSRFSIWREFPEKSNRKLQGFDGKSKRPLTIKKQIDGDIIPLLGDKELDALQTVDITKALDAIVARGALVHANRVLSSLKQVFNSAVSRGGMQHNPAACIRAKDIGGTEKPRERYLSLDEIKTLWQFLDGDKNQMALQTKCAIKIILLTGVQTAELRLATFDEFDFEQSLWTIPAKHTKTDSVMKIHLSSQVKALLMELKTVNNSQHVLSAPQLTMGSRIWTLEPRLRQSPTDTASGAMEMLNGAENATG